MIDLHSPIPDTELLKQNFDTKRVRSDLFIDMKQMN